MGGPTHIMINNKQYAINKDKDKNEGTQTSPKSSKVRKIRRIPRHKAETNGAVWQWQHANGKWEDYPMHVCQQLNYLHDKETIYYQPHGHDQQYTITKSSGKIAKQTNVETQKTKKVRRKPKAKKKVNKYYENAAYLTEYQIALAMAVIITLLTTLFITVHYKII